MFPFDDVIMFPISTRYDRTVDNQYIVSYPVESSYGNLYLMDIWILKAAIMTRTGIRFLDVNVSECKCLNLMFFKFGAVSH